MIAFAQPYGHHPTSTSSNRVVVGLRDGLVRDARPGEWDTSKPIASHSDDPFRERPVVEGTNVSYLRRRFPASGEIIERYALSPDGNWLAVISYTGKVNRGRELFDFAGARGELYISIFQTSTGTRAAELSGRFFAEDPFESLDHATWISDRHFLVPTSGHLGAMLCDMRPAAPVQETVWDFISSTNEILGFWEEAQLVGYFNVLNSLRLHTVVRVADDEDYSIKPDLSVRFPACNAVWRLGPGQ
jgi:hypothetical protein